jgi:16S rRNA (uracil1498-N3)-methyltransferase
VTLLLLYPNDFINEKTVRLSDYRHKHVINILRSKVGDKLIVGLINERIGQGEILTLNQEYADLKITLNASAPHPLKVNVVLALPRPIVLNRILLTLSSLGVKKIYLIHSSRVEKSYWKSPVLKEQNVKEQLILGLEQAKDTIMPEVIMFPRFKSFVEDKLPAIMKDSTALVAHPGSKKRCPSSLKKQTTIIIGPEGGFIPYEIELLEKFGVQPVRLTERILKVETFIPVILSKLFY